jgi:hypothetical protein
VLRPPARSVVALLLIAIIASACDTGFKFSTSPSDQKGPASTVPSGSSGSTSTTSDAPMCVSADLQAKSSTKQNPNDVGGAIGDVIIYNSKTTPCQIRGAPTLHLLGATGSPLTVQDAASVSPAAAPVVLQPRGKSTAELVFTWQNWCRADPGALEMQIGLAEKKGTLIAPFKTRRGTYIPACVTPDKPSELRVQYAYVAAGANSLQA